MGLSVFPNPCVGSDKLGLCLDYCEGTWMWRGAHRSFGLVSGMSGPFSYPHQLPPSPCVRIVWARAVIIPATIAISTCLFGLTLIAAIRGVLMMTLRVSRLFFIPFYFPLFLDDLFSFEFLWSLTFLFIWCSRTLFSFGFPSVYLASGPFLVFFFFSLIPGPSASLSRHVLFYWYDKALGFGRLGFVYTVRLRHGPESFFIFTYRR